MMSDSGSYSTIGVTVRWSEKGDKIRPTIRLEGKRLFLNLTVKSFKMSPKKCWINITKDLEFVTLNNLINLVPEPSLL
jgi:hypothetical protein